MSGQFGTVGHAFPLRPSIRTYTVDTQAQLKDTQNDKMASTSCAHTHKSTVKHTQNLDTQIMDSHKDHKNHKTRLTETQIQITGHKQTQIIDTEITDSVQ